MREKTHKRQVKRMKSVNRLTRQERENEIKRRTDTPKGKDICSGRNLRKKKNV